MRRQKIMTESTEDRKEKLEWSPNGPKSFGLMIPADLRCLDNVRRMISDLAGNMGFTRGEIGSIEVAVDEACTNAIEHAYREISVKPPIRIEIKMEPDRLTVDVIDSGPGFDYQQESLPSFPDHWFRGNVRGAGLYLISECMDEVAYERNTGGGNRMRLIKYKNSRTPEKADAS